jgi:uncharacterized protein YndB with AHSA1/START domain
MELRFQVHGKIRKPVAEGVRRGRQPQELSGYFTTGGSGGPLVVGSTVTWDFADFPRAFPVHVREVVPNRLIVLQWKAADGDYDTTVRIELEALGERSTLVRISESGWTDTQKGLDSSYGNCMGWTQMLCRLKIYAEEGKNLREFFF